MTRMGARSLRRLGAVRAGAVIASRGASAGVFAMPFLAASLMPRPCVMVLGVSACLDRALQRETGRMQPRMRAQRDVRRRRFLKRA